MNLAGLPAQISSEGILHVTTEPAPITLLAPIVTPFRMMERVPINTSSSIIIGRDFRFNLSNVPSLRSS